MVASTGLIVVQSVFSILGFRFSMDVVNGTTLVGDPLSGIAMSPQLVLLPGITAHTGHSLLFDGTNSVDFGNHDLECLGNLERCPEGITIAAWLKVGTKASVNPEWYYVTAGGHTFRSHGWTWYQRYGKFNFAAKTTTTRWSVASISLPTETWVHVITSWNAADGIKVYVNFSLNKTITSATSRSSQQNLYKFTLAGVYQINDGQLKKFGNFTIDELKILRKSVTSDIIKEIQLSTIS